MDILNNISIIFLSIFFESLPFLLLGSLISSIIAVYVPDEFIVKIIPKNKILGSLFGIFLGFFIPACDCAVIPISKRLIKKKVPINVAVSFMLSSPIINPVVLLSTYYAFSNKNIEIFYFRIILGILIALIVGIIIGILFNKKDVILDKEEHDHEEEIEEDFEDLISEFGKHKKCCHHCEIKKTGNIKNDILSIIKNTGYDMFDVVKYLMFGALLASIIQVLLPRSILLEFNSNNILSILTLMIFAYLISLCSTSDSFVGKSLLSSFSKTSILAYLLLGPMIDIKNTIVLFGNYKKSFVLTLILLIFTIIFITSLLVVNIL